MTVLRRWWPTIVVFGVASVTTVWAIGRVWGAVAVGNIAEWVAAVGTVGAFAATLVLLRQGVQIRRDDVAERERRQAALVSCWVDRTGGAETVHVLNASDVVIHVVIVTASGDVTSPPVIDLPALRPDEEAAETWPHGWRQPALSFFDNVGAWELDHHGSLRPRDFT